MKSAGFALLSLMYSVDALADTNQMSQHSGERCCSIVLMNWRFDHIREVRLTFLAGK